MSYEQKFEDYYISSQGNLNDILENMSNLGWETVSVNTVTEKSRMKANVTFRRDKKLKYLSRLIDIENKISELINIKDNEVLYLNNQKQVRENNYRKFEILYKFFLWVLSFLGILGAIMLFFAIISELKFAEGFSTYLVSIVFIALSVFLIFYSRKTLNNYKNAPYDEGNINKIDNLITNYYQKAKLVNKKMKEE